MEKILSPFRFSSLIDSRKMDYYFSHIPFLFYVQFYWLYTVYLCQNKSHNTTGLLAMAVGIDQKGLVNEIVKKVVVLSSCFFPDRSLSFTTITTVLLLCLVWHWYLMEGLVAVSGKWFCCDAFSLRWGCRKMEWFGMEWPSHSRLCCKPNKMV